LKTTSHVEEGLRKSFGCIINEILEAEMDELLGNEKYKHIVEKKENYRNGYSKKILRSSFGNVEIEIPRDRNTEFNPVIVPKHTRNIFELEKQIINDNPKATYFFRLLIKFTPSILKNFFHQFFILINNKTYVFMIIPPLYLNYIVYI